MGPPSISWKSEIAEVPPSPNPAAGVGLLDSEDDGHPGSWMPPTDIDPGAGILTSPVRGRDLTVQKANRVVVEVRQAHPLEAS